MTDKIMDHAAPVSSVGEPGSAGEMRTFRDFTPTLGWRWRSNGGELHAPAAMETRHLFFTVRMIWNNFMPQAAQVGRVKLYTFGPQYTDRYLREAVLHIGQELMGRPNLLPEWREQLDRMAAWVRGTGWAEARLLSGPRAAISTAVSPPPAQSAASDQTLRSPSHD